MNATDSTGETRALAAFAANLRYEDIPEQVVAHIRLSILDGIGCCLFGITLPWTRMLAETVIADGGDPVASLLGRGEKLPVAGAVLVNATAGHAFEIDDIHRDSILHPNSITVPVALNMAEMLGGLSGREAVTAIIAGYEVANRIGMAAGTDLLLRGFHPQGTSGAIAAAVTAGRAVGLGEEQMLQAIGIAGSLGAGLMAAQEGAMEKRLHSGRAAEAGVRAAQLAAKGFTGIENLVEVDYGGFLSSFAGSVKTERITEGLGERWEAAETGFKPHATVTSIHSALDALSTIMRENDLTAGDIANIHARISHATYVHCAWPYTAQSVTAAQMNLYYGLAMIALDGRAFAAQFRDDRIAEPDVMEFITRITAETDPEIEGRGREYRHMCRLEVTTTDGRHFFREEEHRRGSPQNPVSAADIETKFREISEPVITAAAADRLVGLVGGFEGLPDVRQVTAAITGGLKGQ
jgi:2-methylcitrate dehydratase PrpD